MTQSEWHDEWKSVDLWSEADLQALCSGLEPNAARPSTAALNDAAEKIRRAVLAKRLPVASQPIDATAGDVMYAHHRFFEPAAAVRWAAPKFPAFPYSLADFESKNTQAIGAIDSRSEATYLMIIGALLELVRTPRAGRNSDAAVIKELVENYSDKPGISKTTLEVKFASAKRRLHST